MPLTDEQKIEAYILRHKEGLTYREVLKELRENYKGVPNSSSTVYDAVSELEDMSPMERKAYAKEVGWDDGGEWNLDDEKEVEEEVRPPADEDIDIDIEGPPSEEGQRIKSEDVLFLAITIALVLILLLSA